jgi:hypothetical protein
MLRVLRFKCRHLVDDVYDGSGDTLRHINENDETHGCLHAVMCTVYDDCTTMLTEQTAAQQYPEAGTGGATRASNGMA